MHLLLNSEKYSPFLRNSQCAETANTDMLLEKNLGFEWQRFHPLSAFFRKGNRSVTSLLQTFGWLSMMAFCHNTHQVNLTNLCRWTSSWCLLGIGATKKKIIWHVMWFSLVSEQDKVDMPAYVPVRYEVSIKRKWILIVKWFQKIIMLIMTIMFLVIVMTAIRKNSFEHKSDKK